MSAAAAPPDDAPREMSEEEYLAFERASPTKHEWRNGRMVPMPCVSPVHNLIASNLIGTLANALAGRRCLVLPSSQRIHIAAAFTYTYADVLVTRERPKVHQKDPDSLVNPCVVFEVLSSSTEAYDRGEKFYRYMAVPSLTEYVLVEQLDRHIDHFQRLESGQWLLTTYPGERGALFLPTLDCRIPVSAIYADLDLLDGTSASPVPPSAISHP